MYTYTLNYYNFTITCIKLKDVTFIINYIQDNSCRVKMIYSNGCFSAMIDIHIKCNTFIWEKKIVISLHFKYFKQF